jgi:hypothetical protein
MTHPSSRWKKPASVCRGLSEYNRGRPRFYSRWLGLQPVNVPGVTRALKPNTIVQPGRAPRPKFDAFGLNDKTAPLLGPRQGVNALKLCLYFHDFCFQVIA